MRIQRNQQGKIAIAKEAVKLIRNGNIVSFDGGATTEVLASCIQDVSNVTFVVNSLPIAITLTDKIRAGEISGTVIVPVAVLILGAVLFIRGRKVKKTMLWILGIAMMAVGLLGALENLNILSGVPIFQYGIPAVLSVYFDLSSLQGVTDYRVF